MYESLPKMLYTCRYRSWARASTELGTHPTDDHAQGRAGLARSRVSGHIPMPSRPLTRHPGLVAPRVGCVVRSDLLRREGNRVHGDVADVPPEEIAVWLGDSLTVDPGIEVPATLRLSPPTRQKPP